MNVVYYWFRGEWQKYDCRYNGRQRLWNLQSPLYVIDRLHALGIELAFAAKDCTRGCLMHVVPCANYDDPD